MASTRSPTYSPTNRPIPCDIRSRTAHSGAGSIAIRSRIAIRRLDEGREAIEDTTQTEFVGVLGAVRTAICGTSRGTDAGSYRIGIGVKHPGKQRCVGRPPLLVVHCAVLLGDAGGGSVAGAALDETEQIGQCGVHLDVVETEVVQR